MPQDDKNRSCSLWLCITQNQQETWYRIKQCHSTSRTKKWILFKHIEDTSTDIRYTVDVSSQGHCKCSCPDYVRKRYDCKHILALKINGVIGE